MAEGAYSAKVKVHLAPDASVLHEGSKEFKRLARGLKAPGTAHAAELARRAKEAGYQVVAFARDDAGWAVMDESVIEVDDGE